MLNTKNGLRSVVLRSQ